MKELMVKGTQTFLGKEIKVIEGGFGENQRVVLAKTVAEIHDSKLIHVNELINKNINRFNTNDILDLKVIGGSDNNFESFGFTRMQVAKANNIYLLSERGYTKLVAMMDNKNEKKWEVMDQLIDEYFAMRKVIKENSLEAKVMNELSEMREEYVSSCEEIVDAFYEVKGDINLIHQTLNMMAEGFKTMNSTIATLVSIQQQPRVMPKKSRDTSTVTDIAKELRIKPKEVNDILEKEHIIERRNNSIYARPTVQKSWYRNNQYRDGNKVTYYITYTEEGREGVIKIIKKHLPEQMKF
jgi:hypothetical protein